MDLLAQLAEKRGQLDALLKVAEGESRAFTDEENTQLDALEAEIKGLQATIKRAESARTLSAEVAATEERMNEAVGSPEGPASGMTEVTPEVRVGTDREAEQPFDSLGDNLLAIMRACAPGATADKRLLRMRDEHRAASGQNETVPSDGGFLVQTDHAVGLLQKSYNQGVVSSRVRRFPIGANANGITINAIKETSRVAGSRWGGVRGYWLAEAGALTQSQMEFRQIEMKLKKAAVLAYATGENLQDATALGGLIGDAAANEITYMTEEAILFGSGAGQPLGIHGHASQVEVAKEAGQAADTFVAANAFKMFARLPASSRGNAVWLINQDVEPELMNLVDDEGQFIFLPAGRISDDPFGRLLGRPVIPIEQAKTVGDAGDIQLVDLSQYGYIDKGGVRANSSIHVRFLFDEEAFRFIVRLDGQPLWESALTPANGSNTISPFIRLAARA